MKPMRKYGPACDYMSRTDRVFDALLPVELRRMSAMHWTPASVALRVADLLAPARPERILDVGAGVGKLCTLGALSLAGTWFGVEQHERLVSVARQVARELGVDRRTAFIHGNAIDLDWNEFDALYLYNPFELPLFPHDADPSAADVCTQITRVQQKLARLLPGTRVVTLEGFGGEMPETFQRVYHEYIPAVGLELDLWLVA